MALPNFSPSGGIGSTYTDPQTGTNYVYKGVGNWVQISSGGKTTANQQSSQPTRQKGGWYDNPVTGKNQRWWGEGTWTNGEEPGSSTSGYDTNSNFGGNDMASQILKQIEDIQKKTIENITAPYVKAQQSMDEYLTKNPFTFDEAFSKQAVEAEYNPWYQEKLTRYLTSAKRELTQGLGKIGEQYEGMGLYTSGKRMSSQGQLKEYATTEMGQQETDVERERRYAVEAGVTGRKGEAMQDYQMQVANKQRSLFTGTSFPYPGYGGNFYG